jgi:hypothetical protein
MRKVGRKRLPGRPLRVTWLGRSMLSAGTVAWLWQPASSEELRR